MTASVRLGCSGHLKGGSARPRWAGIKRPDLSGRVRATADACEV